MKRSLVSCILAFVLVFSAAPGTLLAQTPVASATPNPFALPVNLRIVRIHQGNGFDFLRLPAGNLLRVNTYLVNDGQVTVPVPPSIQETYAALRIEDMYVAYVVLAPEDDPVSETMITVDIRLLTFPDGGAAASMVESSIDVLEAQAREDPTASQDLVAIADVPSHNQAIVGVTGTDPLVDATTGAQDPARMQFTRFFAQEGTIVASVKVGSFDPGFNDAVARGLLAEQLDCLQSGTFCNPVPLPAEVPFSPAMPGATPVATRPTGSSQGRRLSDGRESRTSVKDA